jgi:ubiquinone/menaquinone biosynthesis C-methylase UbiE
MTDKLASDSPEFEAINKNYYIKIEDYDWVEATDKLVGLESFFHRLRQATFLKVMKKSLNPEWKILDAGCGTGLFSRHMPPGACGIDINCRHIAKAKIYAPQINFQVADLESLPYPDNYFNCIICTEVIEHFPKPEKMLAELKRVLSPTGSLYGTVPSQSLFWRFRFLSSTKPSEPYHHYYQKKELSLLLEKYFKIKDLKQINLHSTWLFILEK